MITQESVVQKILDYLNVKIDLATLVHWSEDALYSISEADEEIPNEAAIMHVLGYIGAGDTPHFPLTWEILTGFLEQLGTKVHVVSESIQ